MKVKCVRLNFLDCPGYKVSKTGNVYSLWIKIGRGIGNGSGCKSIMGHKWRRLKPTPTGEYGHLYVSLRRTDGTQRAIPIATLVLEAFVGPRPPGMEARHFPNRDTSNNKVNNLRWSSHVVNCHDQVIHGTKAQGDKHGKSKLTNKNVRKIKRLYSSGRFLQRELASLFGVTPQNISCIITEKSWRG